MSKPPDLELTATCCVKLWLSVSLSLFSYPDLKHLFSTAFC